MTGVDNYIATKNLKKVNLKDENIKRVVIYFSNAILFGIDLYDKYNNVLLETSFPNKKTYQQQETILEDDEKIIGFRARRQNLN